MHPFAPRADALRRHGADLKPSPLLAEISVAAPLEALRRLASSEAGLAEAEAERRLAEHGPNAVGAERRHGRLRLLVRALLSPLVLLLAALAIVSIATGNHAAAAVMGTMILLGVGLRFAQEARADAAAERLKAMIRVTATVLRDGQPREAPIADLVPGDVVQLSARDMLPADVRILSCRDLFVAQASLTGESLPVEKHAVAAPAPGETALEAKSLCFLGTSVESGTATAVVVETGERTVLGGIAKTLAEEPPRTAFDRGVARFTLLMIRFMAVMVPLVFVINGLTRGDWHEAFFFALAVAVGLTPEMLPMIVSVCLSRGALAMSDADLAEAAQQATLFARMAPAHKQRVIQILQGRGRIVGVLGDGINDSPALRVADAGISVDTAVDVAKEAADIILLEKSLLVVDDGVLEGRKVFCNILKYVRMGASSNFGNMFSVLGASAILPFVPMAPLQILTNNLLYDFSQVPIPTDDVDPEQIARPRAWSMHDLSRFILFIGRAARSSTTRRTSRCSTSSAAGTRRAPPSSTPAGSSSRC